MSHLALLAATVLMAQDVHVTPKWKQGDVLRLEYLRTREDSRRPESNGTSKTPVDVTILSADVKGFAVRWKSGKTELPAGMKVPENVLRIQDKAMELFVDIQLSAEGEFASVLNAKEVSARMGELVSVMTKDLEQDAQAKALIRQVLNPDLLLAAASSDAQTYFGLYGVALKPKEKITVDLDQPFPLAPGKTLRSRLEVELVDLKDGLARFQTTTRFDPAAVKTAMADVFLKAGIKAEDLDKVPPVEILDTGSFLFETQTGLIREALTDRRTMTGGVQARRDKKEFRLRLGK